MKVDLELKGRRALVNGASQGIGYAIARLLALEGARVAIAARREPASARPRIARGSSRNARRRWAGWTF
jgi:3-oxoacyl-[acyl-carrier protein] reductase